MGLNIFYEAGRNPNFKKYMLYFTQKKYIITFNYWEIVLVAHKICFAFKWKSVMLYCVKNVNLLINLRQNTGTLWKMLFIKKSIFLVNFIFWGHYCNASAIHVFHVTNVTNKLLYCEVTLWSNMHMIFFFFFMRRSILNRDVWCICRPGHG